MADGVDLIGPAWAEQRIDAILRESIEVAVLVTDARGLAVLREAPAEFVTVEGVPVAEIIAIFGIPRTVAFSAAPEIVVIVVVGASLVRVSVAIVIVSVVVAELALGLGGAKLTLELVHVLLDGLGKATRCLIHGLLREESVLAAILASGRLVAHSARCQVNDVADPVVGGSGEE